MQNNNFDLSPDFASLLFDELYVVKEKDFSKEFKFLGSNKLKLLIIFNEPNDGSKAGDAVNFIRTVIEKGLKKNPDDAAIININEYPDATLAELISFTSAQNCIIWGAQSWIKQQQISSSVHATGNFLGTDCLFAEEPLVYLQNNDSKTKLWAALQKMFY